MFSSTVRNKPFKSMFKTTDDILNQMILVKAPTILRFADEDFDSFGTPLDIINGVPQKPDLKRLDTFGMRLREIVISANDGYRIYLVRKGDGQLLFDMLEEYLIRTQHNFEYNRSEEDVSFRHYVQDFANNMVTISNAVMLKNKAADKIAKLIPNQEMVDTFLTNGKKKKATVSY